MIRFATLLLAAVTAGSAFAETPTLRNEVLVHSDVITLGDLIDGLGEAGKVSVFAAPPLGRSGTIQSVRIIDAARDYGIGGIDPGGLTQVSVRRAGRKLTAETVLQVISASLQVEHALPATIALTLDEGQGDFFVDPNVKIGLRTKNLSVDLPAGRFSAEIESIGAAAPLSFKVTGSIADEIETPVLARDVPRDTPLAPSDFTMAKQPRNALMADVVFDPATFKAMTAKRALRRGETVRALDIAPTMLVQRGDLVTLIVDIPGMTLSTRGRAQDGGTSGQEISVQNLQSKRVILGVIVGPGRVVVDPGASASRLAAATP
jgi:flagellar basal body P-ring formation protein FlgA